MDKTGLILTSWSSAAAELKGKNRTVDSLLLALSDHARISTWDMQSGWLRRLIKQAENQGLVERNQDDYPWHKFKLTDKGIKQCALYRSSLTTKEQLSVESRNSRSPTRSRKRKTI